MNTLFCRTNEVLSRSHKRRGQGYPNARGLGPITLWYVSTQQRHCCVAGAPKEHVLAIGLPLTISAAILYLVTTKSSEMVGSCSSAAPESPILIWLVVGGHSTVCHLGNEVSGKDTGAVCTVVAVPSVCLCLPALHNSHTHSQKRRTNRRHSASIVSLLYKIRLGCSENKTHCEMSVLRKRALCRIHYGSLSF